MRKWVVTHTSDKENFKESEVMGTTYTDAYVNFMCKHPNDLITELKEKEQ